MSGLGSGLVEGLGFRVYGFMSGLGFRVRGSGFSGWDTLDASMKASIRRSLSGFCTARAL